MGFDITTLLSSIEIFICELSDLHENKSDQMEFPLVEHFGLYGNSIEVQGEVKSDKNWHDDVNE